MDGGALRLTAGGGPSSGQCRPAPRSRHAQRALTTQLPAWVGKRIVKAHSSRIGRYAARGGGAERAVDTRRVKEKQTRRVVA